MVGHGVEIPTGGRPAAKIGGQPPDGIVIEGGGGYCFEEKVVVHDVEGLGKIQRHRGRAVGGFGPVETGCNLVGEGEEGGGGGAVPSESMLGVRRLQVVGEAGEEEALQDFDGGAEEGNGTVGGGEATGFVGFGDGNKVGLLPYCRYGSTIEGEVI